MKTEMDVCSIARRFRLECIRENAASFSGDMLRRVAMECRRHAPDDTTDPFEAGWMHACHCLAIIFEEAAKGADIYESRR